MANPYSKPLHRLAVLLTSVACCGAAPAHARADPEPQPDAAIGDARLTLDRWIEVRRTISKERTDWVLGKEIMQDRIDLLRRSIEEVRQQIEAQQLKVSGFDDSIAALEAKNRKLKEASEELATLLDQMEARTRVLLEAAPAPLAKSVEPLAAQMPGHGEAPTPAAADGSPRDDASAEAASEEAEAPLSRRVENVVGVLYLFNKFAGKIEQTSELVERSDGSKLSVDAVYLGLSYGFYVDDENKTAAAGWAGPGGWAWTPTDDAAVPVRQAIDVLNKDQPAAFVGLPVEVK